jgi:hypothetical protein
MQSQIHRPETYVNKVFVLDREFMAMKENDTDTEDEVPAKLLLDPQQPIFEKPEESKHQHLKALYVNLFVNGKPMGKMMVNGAAAINVVALATFRKLGKCSEDLIKANVILKDFEGNTSDAQGVLNAKLAIGCKTFPTTFFIIGGKGPYNLLHGRD